MIELVIRQRRRDLGSFEVGRVLPFAKRRMVGPYIGLSTITYLYDGEIMHRDSLGWHYASDALPVFDGDAMVGCLIAGRLAAAGRHHHPTNRVTPTKEISHLYSRCDCQYTP